ncbi:MAG TPA: DUF169 domain-containing protein [Candidatus Sulfotelmatobacter sp.]|nr:DUF169 domain-containing protein [Candidatus Sulfotelmatobacter sp.]
MTVVDAGRALGERCRALWPDRPAPIGIARISDVPAGVTVRTGLATSACQLWREATDGVFAMGSDHGLCPIGRVTQGFASGLPAGDPLVTAMVESGYVDPAEMSSMPTLPMGHQWMLYGPLDRLPVDAEAAVFLALPEQAMLLNEALGSARLDRPRLEMLGRPTCAAVAAAIVDDAPRGSLACTGARMFAGMQPGELLLVVPASSLEELDAALDGTLAANQRVATIDAAIRDQVHASRT